MTNVYVEMTDMDSLDRQLIRLLRSDARMTVAELSKRLKVARGTVNYRLRRLQNDGIICGYTVRLHLKDQPEVVHAWMTVAVKGDNAQTVVQRLLDEPVVAALHDTNGQWDLLVELEAMNLSDLSTALERIRSDPGIQSSETSIHLATFR